MKKSEADRAIEELERQRNDLQRAIDAIRAVRDKRQPRTKKTKPEAEK